MKYLLAICLPCVALLAADPAKPEWVKLTRTGNSTRLEWATSYETNIQTFQVVRTIPGMGMTGVKTYTLGVPLLNGNGVKYVEAEKLYHWNWTDTNAVSTQTYFYAIQAVTVDGASPWVQTSRTHTINAPIKRN